MVARRPGKVGLGCLFVLLILAAAAYFGVNIGRTYWRFYEYQDAINQEVKFNADKPDSLILAHLRAAADSLGLPEDARQLKIQRDRRARFIAISADYTEPIELPLMVRLISFHPRAEGSY